MSDVNTQSVDELLEDYATTPVPQNKTVGGVRIGMINGALAFSVPGLITGLEIGHSIGLEQGSFAFLLGGLILSVLATITGLVGMHNRLTACMTMKFVFGTAGANILSFAFVLSLLGWYGVNIDLFSSVTQELWQQLFDYSPQIWLLEITAGVLITLTTIWGFKLLEKISTLFIPLLFLVVAYMLYQSLGYQSGELVTEVDASFSFGEAVSAVVGSFIVSVVLMPDFTRFSASKKDTAAASFLPFFLLSTFVYLASAMAGLAVGERDVLVVMLTLGLGSFAFFLLIVSSWTTNVINLYSASLGLNAINPKMKEWQIIIFAGVLGTIIASFNLLDSFTDFLFSLSIIFTPVAAIYVVDFFLIRSKQVYDVNDIANLETLNWYAVIAWLVGVCASMLVNYGFFTITTIEVCDAVMVSSFVYYFLMKLKTK